MTNPSVGGVHRDNGYAAATVRPYAVTGGRVRSGSSDLPIEALVEVMPDAANSYGLPPEKRAIIQHGTNTFVSIAELSALLKLPLGVTRILVADLAEDNYVTVHTNAPMDVYDGHGSNHSGLSLSVLESVLNGISTL